MTSTAAKMTDIQICDTVTSALGRKFAKLLPPLTVHTRTPMISPFGLSLFPGEKAASVQRASLDLRCTDPEVLEIFQKLDAWAPGEIAKHSERIMGKKMTLEQCQAAYRPCLRCKEGFVPLLHAKVSLDGGPNSTTFWDEQKQRREAPDDFRHLPMLLHLSVPHLWLSGGMVGLVVNITSAQVVEHAAEQCPF